jgi:hypothetical protein
MLWLSVPTGLQSVRTYLPNVDGPEDDFDRRRPDLSKTGLRDFGEQPDGLEHSVDVDRVLL